MQPTGGIAPSGAAEANGTIAAAQPAGQPDSILGRYFGFVPQSAATRIPRDDVTYGSRRLEQIFAAVRAKGKYVRLFEEPPQGHRMASVPFAYDTWFHVNYKVELACDLKRNELHSLAIRLSTGEIAEHFFDKVAVKKLTPRLPANVHIIPDKMSLSHGASVLERFLENKLKLYDHAWAEEAHDRLLEELARIRVYYENLIKAAEDDKKPDFEAQYRRRQAEVEWQYRPRVHVSVINCGLFHLNASGGP
nr:YqhG family protein [Paenibacillus hamazuiensis]